MGVTTGKSAFQPNIVTDGLVLNLDAINPNSYPQSGTIWYDTSGNNNSGTLTNGTSWTPNGAQTSFSFDGVDDYVNCGTNSSLNFGTGSATIGAWFKTSGNIGALCTKRQGSGFQLYVYSERLYADGAGTPTGVYSTAKVNTNVWKYGVVVYDRIGSLIRLYVNGTADGTTDLGGTTLTDVGSCNIGRATLGGTPRDYFNGTISQVSIYNRALTSQEVLQNYNALKSRFGLT
jgi:hypothetical protein